MGQEIVEAVATSPIYQNGTFNVAYPTDMDAAAFDTAGHYIVVHSLQAKFTQADAKISVELGAPEEGITVTYLGATTIPRNSVIICNFKLEDLTDPLNGLDLGATITSRIKSREQYLNAKDFGLPDSGGDGTTALRAAIAQSTSENKKLILPKGEWRITGTLDNGVNYSNLHLEGVGKGQTTLLMEIPGLAMFTTTGSYGTVHHLTDELPIGTFTCTVASTAGLVVNGMVRIMDTDQPIIQHQTTAATGYAGQLVRIRSIDSETQFTLWGTAEFDYGIDTSIHPITAPSDFSFRGMTIENRIGTGGGLGARGLTFIRSQRVHLEALEFKGIYDDSMTFWTTADWKVLDVDGLDNLSDPADATPYFILAVRGACHGIIQGCFMRHGRHMFDGSAGLEIEAAHIVMSNCIATEMTEAAVDTHVGIRHFELSNFMATAAARDSLGGNGAPGVQLRGRYCSMKNSKIIGYGFGALLAFGDHCRVVDSEFVDCATGVELVNSPQAELARLKIWRPRDNGIHSYTLNAQPGIDDVSIRDIEIYGNPAGAAINIQNWNDTFHVENIYAPDASLKFVNVPHQQYYGASKLDTTYFESVPRYLAKDAVAALESGKLFLTLVEHDRGTQVDTLELICAVAPVGQTHLWMSFYDKDLNLLGVTADKTTLAPTNGQKFTFGMAEPVSTPYKGAYYVGIVQVVAGGGLAPMTVRGVTASSEVAGLAPRLSGLSTTGLTDPASAPDPAAAVGASALIPWVGTGSSPASAYIAAMTVKPDATRAGLIRTLIGDLVGADLWPKIDLLYLMASHDDQSSKLNAKSPSVYALSEFGTVNFTVDEGQKGNGSTGYLSALLYNPSTYGGAYSLDAAVFGVWVREAPTIAGSQMIYMGTSHFNKSSTGDTYQARINDTLSLNADPTGVGHWAVRRTAAAERSIWKDAVSLANDTQASTVAATAFRIFSTAGGSFSDAQLAAAYIGGGFTDDDMETMDTILRTYFTATGAI